jgi:son of sevenless-like protein
VNPPIIPYLGMYLTDLTFIEEGNKDYVTEHNLPNMHKRRLTAQTIGDVQTYQDVKYQYVEIPEMISKCFGEATFDDNQLYEISEYLEPRAGKYVCT